MTKTMAMLMMLMMMMLMVFSGGEVYKVGDSDGWSVAVGSLNYYTAWTVSKNFQVGATYTSEHDSVPINSIGRYFFPCGKPGHCQNDQKVDIRIPKLQIILGSPSPAPTSASAPTRTRRPASAAGLRLWPLVGLFALLASALL